MKTHSRANKQIQRSFAGCLQFAMIFCNISFEPVHAFHTDAHSFLVLLKISLKKIQNKEGDTASSGIIKRLSDWRIFKAPV